MTGQVGSYEIHNKEAYRWENPEEWEKIIETRGIDIFEFMKEFISAAHV